MKNKRRPIFVGILAGSILLNSCVNLKPTYKLGTQKACEISTQQDITKANRLLLDFPDKIPGALSIDKYLTPKAEYCLVHIYQRHLHPDFPENKPKVKKVQDNIYLILSYLINNNNLSMVYGEGINDFNISRLEIERAYFYLQEFIPRNDILEKKVKKTLDKWGPEEWLLDKWGPEEWLREFYIRDRNQIKETLSYNAVNRLYFEGKIEIRPAEEQETQRNADLAMFFLGENLKIANTNIPAPRKEFLCGVMDDRENALLRIISEQENSLCVTVYGGAHAWGGKKSCGRVYSLKGRTSLEDNLKKWNEKNPDKKFSLIEVLPVDYK